MVYGEGPERPDEGGYMTLSEAAYWVATDGGKKKLEPSVRDHWEPAFAELLGAVVDGRVEIIGRLRGCGLPQQIDAVRFSKIPVVTPYEDIPLKFQRGKAPHVRTVGHVPDDYWEEVFSDELYDGGGTDRVAFSHLQVKRADVARLWPFTTPLGGTGAAGRPTSSHLVEQEMRRRAANGSLAPRLSKETEYLETWLRKTHPGCPRMTQKTIENAIRKEYRSLMISGYFGASHEKK